MKEWGFYREESEAIRTIHGEKNVAESITAKIDVDMFHSPSDAHISSWAGVCSGNNESEGKRCSVRITPGNKFSKR
ncbi:MAG: transposase [bacterium]